MRIDIDHARRFIGIAALLLMACVTRAQDDAVTFTIDGSEGTVLNATVLETFDNPWAMSFLPDGRSLVTEKSGAIWLLGTDGAKVGRIANVPEVVARGQGGLGDIVIAPDFADSALVYLSYVERDADDDSLSGAAVERATLALSSTGGELSAREVIWRQYPKVGGNGHYGHRLAISPDGFLFITSGERQKFTPAQDRHSNLGKVVRLVPDGSIPDDNPFIGDGEIPAQLWSLGHRNPLGIAFDADGQLWVHEMGPRGGDELNRIVRAGNYGYPEVSEGSHYSGQAIPSHASNPAFRPPAIAWNPSISPAGFVIHDGASFADWRGAALIGGLSSRALIRVTLTANGGAEEAERHAWGSRVREVEQGNDGSIHVLEDGGRGRLIRLEPTD